VSAVPAYRSWKVTPPLSRKTRAVLAWRHAIDGVAIWFSDHGHWRLAMLTWQVTGQWNRRNRKLL